MKVLIATKRMDERMYVRRVGVSLKLRLLASWGSVEEIEFDKAMLRNFLICDKIFHFFIMKIVISF